MSKIGIIMNGVTGRMGTNQHLVRSIAEIIRQGGVRAGDTILAIDSVPMKDFDQISAAVRAAKNRQIDIRFRPRRGRILVVAMRNLEGFAIA